MSRLPNLLIIGAVKSGTSSLHYYLDLHPEIMMSKKKELYYFVESRNWHRGVEWYSSHFSRKAKIAGESTPGYTLFPKLKGVPKRIYELLPEVKLIYLIRDPIERAKSHYIANYSSGGENRTFHSAFENLDNNPFIFPSLYANQLEQYFPFFDVSQILVITLENLHKNPRKTMQKVFHFLAVEDTFYSNNFHTIFNPSDKKRRKNRIGILLKRMAETKPAEVFSPEFRRRIGNIVYRPFSTEIQRPDFDSDLNQKLLDYFQHDICKLREYSGLSLEGWSR